MDKDRTLPASAPVTLRTAFFVDWYTNYILLRSNWSETWIRAPYFSATSFRRQPLLTWCDAAKRSAWRVVFTDAVTPPEETVKREWLKIVYTSFRMQ